MLFVTTICLFAFAMGLRYLIKEESKMLSQYEISTLAPIPEEGELDINKLKEDLNGQQWKDIIAKLRRHGYEVVPIKKEEMKCQK